MLGVTESGRWRHRLEVGRGARNPEWQLDNSSKVTSAEGGRGLIGGS